MFELSNKIGFSHCWNDDISLTRQLIEVKCFLMAKSYSGISIE
jgi:hypothetical protein